MSFYASYRNHAAFLANRPSSTTGEVPADTLAAVHKAVEAIISSGAVSRQGACEHLISISGHQNPDHEFTEGMANDSVTVNVTQIPLEYWKEFDAREARRQEFIASRPASIAASEPETSDEVAVDVAADLTEVADSAPASE